MTFRSTFLRGAVLGLALVSAVAATGAGASSMRKLHRSPGNQPVPVPETEPAPRPDRGTEILIARAEDRRDPSDPQFADWLGHSSPAVRARAALALGRIGAAASLPRLLPLLADKLASVRARAAFAAGLIGDSAALEPLGVTARDPDWMVRRRAVEALSRLGSRRAAPLLGAALGDLEPRVRREACVGLWRLQDSSAVDSTLPLLADPDPELRWRAVYALERSGSRRAPGAVRPLLSDRDSTVRMIAVRAAGRMKDYLAEDALGRALSDPSWRVRVNAAAALGALADSTMGPAVVRALGDSSPYVRSVAATALGAMRFSAAVPALAKLAQDPEAAPRAAAGVALVKILGAAAHGPVRALLGGNVTFVRAQVLEALGEAGCREAWAFGEWAVAHGDPALQAAALRYFAALRDGHALPLVLKALRADDFLLAANAAGALAESGDSSRVTEFEILYDRWPGEAAVDARLAAVDGAAKLWPSHVSRFLRKALDDPDRRVRASAFAALRALPPGALPDSLPAALPETPLGVSRTGWSGVSTPTPLPRAALLRTTRGDIRIEFERDLSPNTVANFVGLARRGYFDGLTWHRVVPNFVIQGGDPHGDGEGGPGYAIRCEMNELPYDRGRVGMALSGKDTGGSQFFITQSAQPHLNGRYTIFARVTQGLDVVDRIQQGDRIMKVKLM
jgi:cyclophilin family peptidyl-prolyl cis-trans isomerase